MPKSATLILVEEEKHGGELKKGKIFVRERRKQRMVVARLVEKKEKKEKIKKRESNERKIHAKREEVGAKIEWGRLVIICHVIIIDV